jgi:hypothetical protein
LYIYSFGLFKLLTKLWGTPPQYFPQKKKIKSAENEKVPKTVNGKIVASQWLRAEVVIPM